MSSLSKKQKKYIKENYKKILPDKLAKAINADPGSVEKYLRELGVKIEFKLHDFKKNDLLCALISFLLPLFIYAYTACPKPHVDDCGEYIFGPVTLSVIHPPGYPLFCILGKIFSYLPIGEVAWRINFMSGFFTALASLFLYLIIHAITGKNMWALCGALIFSFSSTAWSQSVVAEVYGLNVFFTLVTMYLLIIWTKTRNRNFLYLFSFIYGLSLTNHHLMSLLGPAYIIYIFWTDPALIKNIKWYLIMGILFMAGLVFYIYLPIRANASPFLNWGNPHNLERFIFHVSRKIYSDVDYKSFYDVGTKSKFFALFIKELISQFYPPLLLVGLFGIYESFKKNLKLSLLLLYAFLSSSFLILYMLQFPYNVEKANVVSVYFIPSYAIFAAWIAIGLNEISKLEWIKENLKSSLNPASWSVALILPLLLLFSNFHKNSLHNNYIAYDYVKSILDSTEPNSIFFGSGDTVLFNALYLQSIENYRKDIKIYDNFGYVSNEYLGGDFNLTFPTKEKKDAQRRIVYNKIIEENYGKRPIYFWDNFDLGNDSKYCLAECGFLFKVVKKNEIYPDSIQNWEKVKIRNLNDLKIYLDERIGALLGVYYERLGRFYFKQNNIAKAEETFEKILKLELRNPAAVSNAGLHYLEVGRSQKALEFFELALKIDPSITEIYLNAALAQHNIGKYEEAVKNYAYFLNHWRGDPKYAELAEKNLKAIESQAR